MSVTSIIPGPLASSRRAAGAIAAATFAWTASIAQAQVPAVQAGADAVARDQARRAAEAQSLDRSARQDAPDSRIDHTRPGPLGPFPVERPCFTINQIVLDPVPPKSLGWVAGYLARFEGRCVGREGLGYILRALQAQFLDRGLVSTRAGLPEQDLSSGTLRITMVPGTIAGIRGGTAKDRRGWEVASPIGKGDLVNTRALEQGLDQMRRVPGRQVSLDLTPGAVPGESYIDLSAKPAPLVFGSISANNFAGKTVGRWQATGALGIADLLGLDEVLTGFYNRRLSSPALPADSLATGGAFSIPYGWWTLSLGGSFSRYSQRVTGQVEDFTTRSRLAIASASLERVVHRDRVSRTSLAISLQRRWGRSYIDDVEIGLQHQDLTDVALTLTDRRRFGRVQVDTALAGRAGIGLLGAQKDEPDQPAALPSARYKIATLDLAVAAPLVDRLGYRVAFRGQIADRTLFGPDLFSVGGPYTVRGYDADRALIGRSGAYLRQELTFRALDEVQPYLLIDAGHVRDVPGTPVGIGTGVRAEFHGALARRIRRDPGQRAASAGSGQTRGAGGGQRGVRLLTPEAWSAGDRPPGVKLLPPLSSGGGPIIAGMSSMTSRPLAYRRSLASSHSGSGVGGGTIGVPSATIGCHPDLTSK